MSERRPPRFPYVAALLCAACLGAAGWTWMRYSYAWELPLGESPDEELCDYYLSINARLVEHERFSRLGRTLVVYHPPARRRCYACRFAWVCADAGATKSDVVWVTTAERVHPPSRKVYLGRVRFTGLDIAPGLPVSERVVTFAIDTTASRFHGASIAGLVVGAMGAFVFTVALRHWLNQRRASHVETAEAEQ